MYRRFRFALIGRNRSTDPNAAPNQEFQTVRSEVGLLPPDILARLNASAGPDDMNLPGFRLHRLRGDLAGFWAVTVRANWRIVFRFEDGQAVDVDYLDYH